MKWNKPTAAVADITTFSADYYPKQTTKHTLPPKLPYIAPSQSMQTHSMYWDGAMYGSLGGNVCFVVCF